MPHILWVIVIILLVFAVLGSPVVGVWPHNYGWYPSGLGVILIIVLLVLLLR